MQHEVVHQAHEIKNVVQTTCCIVGGGPAGVILALLLARKGIPVILLEAHMDFEREFRGDTIHPSTMEVMDQLGLVERLLQIRHTELRRFAIQASGSGVPTVNLNRLRTKYPYVTVMAQARFLDFLTEEAKRYPAFQPLSLTHF
jgi:2-polyprenyl-6-methoxyphenol hydroxylase-like FAD-dependent oxidoreductase